MEKRIKTRIGALVVVGMFVAMLYLPGVISQDGETVLRVDGSYRVNIDDDGDEDDRIFSVSHDDNDAELFRIQENGNVGIGVSNPSSDLEVGGNIRADKEYHHARLELSSWSNEYWVQVEDLVFQGIGFYRPSTSDWQMVIRTSGNVGIGTTNPSQTLHVVGNARITGALYDSNNQPGTGGQILQTTGSGTDWVDPSSISDGDWTISGNNMYSAVSGNVGIGTTSPTAKLEVAGNLNVDSGTLYVDNTNNRVGVGTTSPAGPLHVIGRLWDQTLIVEQNNGADADTVLDFRNENGRLAHICADESDDRLILANDLTRIYIDNADKVGISEGSPVTTLDVDGGLATNTVYVDAVLFPGGYIAGPTDFLILVDTTAGPVTVFLPPVIGVDGQILVIKKIDATGGLPGTVTITPLGGEPIDGWPTPLTFNTQWTTFTIQASGPNPNTPTGQWYTI